MNNAFALFEKNIRQAEEMQGLHEYLSKQIQPPSSFDDLLRSQVVYTVSAFDKLIHDLVRIGMVEIFTGKRTITTKFKEEPFKISLYTELENATIPPKEAIFEREVYRKLSFISYQDPKKIADGLSYIWNENQKWQKISAFMSQGNDSFTKQTLQLISQRRNTIVHESDIDPSTGEKYVITRVECEDMTKFIWECGKAIYNLVKL